MLRIIIILPRVQSDDAEVTNPCSLVNDEAIIDQAYGEPILMCVITTISHKMLHNI